MAHGSRTLQHWDQWLAHQSMGKSLLEAEKLAFSYSLEKQYGKHALLIGVPHQYDLLNASFLPCHSLITPLLSKSSHPLYLIEGDFHALPILTGSIDLVILPHILEFVDNPRQLLSEACRVIKPEGLIIISGFNPYSFWGISKLLANPAGMPWAANFIHAAKVKNWLKLADFSLEKHESTLFLPPILPAKIYSKLPFLEKMGRNCLPKLGGVYVLSARAKVIPLTPIRLKWKQHLSGIRISTTFAGHIARRQSK